VVYFRVVDPENSVVKITDHLRATSQIAQTTLRSVLGQSELDEVLANREQINARLQTIIDERTEPWGVKVRIGGVKEVERPGTLRRAMAQRGEAEREKRAKVLLADGEFQAAQPLADAAAIIATKPQALQLRYLQTLVEISQERNSPIV